jgi:hypothetical protein
MKGSESETSRGKNILKTPSQSIAEHGSTHLSFQLCKEAQIGGLRSKTAQHNARSYLKNSRHIKGW